MEDFKKNADFPLLLNLNLPFKGKGARNSIEQISEVVKGSAIELSSAKELMTELVTEFRQNCHHIPIRMVVQHTPRGSYLRWRTCSINKRQQQYVSHSELFHDSNMPAQLKKILAEYALKMIWLNTTVSILNHNSMALGRYEKDLCVLESFDIVDKSEQD